MYCAKLKRRHADDGGGGRQERDGQAYGVGSADCEEVFDLLRESAEKAIDQGQAHYLLDRMNGDKETDLWKLSHGHSREWNSVVRALRYNDKSRLHEH